MTTATATKILGRRIFGEFSRYRVDVFLTRFGSIEFFLLDVDAGNHGTPAVIGQAETLSQLLSILPDKGIEFLNQRPKKARQIAINLDRHPVKVIKFDAKGVLVECLGTKQRWYSPLENLVLAS